MARKPNYRFDRSERERQKAAKKAKRIEAKKMKSDARKTPQPASSISDPPKK